jgi:N-acetylglucosaminyldiphosphoundecaprenol N-acetyl-beta-D-mannosaminyltransferase
MTSCGFYDPGFVSVDEMSNSSIIDYINECEPDFLVVALGAKKGQQWIMKNRFALNTSVISHLGAVINFVAGHVQRAPVKWQNYGLEWLWRIRQEPKLLKRYFFDAITYSRILLVRILPLYFYSSYLKWYSSGNYPTEIRLTIDENLIVKLTGRLSLSHLQQLDVTFDDIIANYSENVIVDATKLENLDAAIIGRLLLLNGHLSSQNREVFLLGFSNKLRRILHFSSVLNRFKLI